MEILEEYKKYLSENYPNLKLSTTKLYIRNVEEYIAFVKKYYKEKKKCMYLVSEKKVKLYRTHLFRTGYSRKAINHKLLMLSFYEYFLIETGKKKRNATAKILRYKKFRKNILDITENGYEEIIELAKKDSSKYYLMFLLFVRYGISERKIMSIKVDENFDADYKTLYLESKKIELSIELQKALKQYLKDRKRFLGKYKNSYLFVSHISRKNGKAMNKTSLSRAVKIYYGKLINSEDYFGKWSEIY